jgi:hypothetical protein
MFAFRMILAGLALISVLGCQGGPARPSPGTTAPQHQPPPADGTSNATAAPPTGGGQQTEPSEPPAPPPVTFAMITTGLPNDGNWKSDPVFADVNGDGLLDMAATPRVADGARVWFGDGKGNWKDSSSGLKMENSCGGGVAFGDLNEDGKLDLAVGDHCNGVFMYLGDGKGNWKAVVENLQPAATADPSDVMAQKFTGAECIALGDINRDGHLDFVAGSSDKGGLVAFLGDGTGGNWTRVNNELPSPGWALRVRLIDMNNDGNLDLVSTRDEGPRVWLGDGKGGFKAWSNGMPTPSIKGLYYGMDVVDVNRDGMLDVVVANRVDGPEVYYQQSGGYWKKADRVFPQMAGGAMGVAAADLDSDGHVDLVVVGRYLRDVGFVNGVFFLQGQTDGTWKYFSNTGLPESGLLLNWGVGIADVDGDHVLDVAITSGGIVATDRRRDAPALEPRMLVFRTQRAGAATVRGPASP